MVTFPLVIKYIMPHTITHEDINGLTIAQVMHYGLRMALTAQLRRPRVRMTLQKRNYFGQSFSRESKDTFEIILEKNIPLVRLGHLEP